MHELVRKARAFATQAHRRIDQRRKYTNQPYEVHLKSVAALVRTVTDEPEMLAAAWLHDTVEDTSATLEEIEAEFGRAVSELVSDLTDVSKPGDGNRAARKAIDLAHSAQSSSRAKTVKLADLIDNCRDICRHDDRFARVYLSEMAALLEVLSEGDSKLFANAQETLESCVARLGLPAIGSGVHLEPDYTPVDPAQVAHHGRALRLFTHAFSAEDLAEPLRSFDQDRPAGQVAELMRKRGFGVAGLRREGVVTGYVRLGDLTRGRCGAVAQRFKQAQVVDGEAPLSDVIHVLTRHESCFVRLLGDVSGLIERQDMQKPMVRMWLFGIVTFIEIDMTDRIRARWPDGDWTDLITPGRLAKAESLQAERAKRNQHGDLLDCLQLSDKAQILVSVDEERNGMGFQTMGAAKRVVKELESLRNNLAHAQDIVRYDWPQIARMTQWIEEKVGSPG
jgi:hypothetical protein